jgi:hypothetical protein
MDVVVIAEVEEFLPCELGAVVVDDHVGYVETIDDVSEELYHLLRADVGDGSSLDHLENLSTATRRWVKPPGACRSGPTMLRCQTTKGHVIGDGLKRLRREVSLSSV